MIECAILLVVLGVVTLSVAATGKGFTYRQRAHIAFVAGIISFAGSLVAALSR